MIHTMTRCSCGHTAGWHFPDGCRHSRFDGTSCPCGLTEREVLAGTPVAAIRLAARDEPAVRCEPAEHDWEHDGSSGDWCTRCFVRRADIDPDYAKGLAR